MAKARRPRKGSLQFYPRKRTKRQTARVRAWSNQKEAKLLGFAGYKVGMTHITFTDTRPNALTKDETIAWPCTIIECPPLKAIGIRYYTPSHRVVADQFAPVLDKELARKISLPKSKKSDTPKQEEPAKTSKKESDNKSYDDLVLLIATQPKLASLGKKKPELFEMAIGGKKEEKEAYARNMLGKEINVSDIFNPGEYIDIHAITKGKGLQGPVKRFGISLKIHKSEKGRRNPGSLGSWKGQVNVMWKVAHAGQMGYFQRTEYNKCILSIDQEPKNPKSGFRRFGLIKNPSIIIKGSIPGPKKRLIKMTRPLRSNRKTMDPITIKTRGL